MLCLYGPQWKQDHEYEPIKLKLHVLILSIIKRQTEKSICVSHEGFDLNIDSFMFFTLTQTLVFSQWNIWNAPKSLSGLAGNLLVTGEIPCKVAREHG
jgi:hypothetical protein